MKNIKVLIVISFALIVIACGGAEERKAAYMEKAEKSLNAGDLDKARIELKNVLQIDPKDADAYFMLGEIFENKQDFRKAFGNYNKALELNPENLEYQAKIGLYHLLLINDLEKAKEVLALIQNQQHDNIHGLLLEATIHLKEKDTTKAKEISQEIFTQNAANINNAMFLSAIYLNEKDYNSAITVLDESIQLNPDNVNLLNKLSNVLLISKNYKRTEEVLKQIVVIKPDVFDSYVNLASYYQITEQPEKAEKIIREAISLDEEDLKRKLVLIEYIQRINGTSKAIQELKSMIAQNKHEGKLHLTLAVLQLEDKDIDGASDTLKSAIKEFSEEETGITSRVELAKIYIQKGDVALAIKVINEAGEIAPNDAAVNLIKGKIAYNQKQFEDAIISLRQVIKDRPDIIDAYFLLFGAHVANNENEQASEILERAYENNRGNLSALLSLAKYYYLNKVTDKAEVIADDYLKLNDKNYDILSIKSAILNKNKKYNEAFKLAEKMIVYYPNKENGYMQSVPYLLSQNKSDEAISLLERGYAKTNDAQILKLLSQILIASGDPDEAVEKLKQYESGNEPISLLLAKAHLAKKDTESAKNVLRDSIMQDKSRTQSYISLATVYSSEKDTRQAVSVLEDGVNANPDDARLAITLAGFYERAGDIDSAIEQYEKILANKPDNLLANNNLAALLSDHKTDEASLKRAKEIADKLKEVNQPVIQDTVGWVYYKTGNYADAVSILEKVVAAQPDIPVFNYHLGMAYHKSGKNAEARKSLEAALASDGDFQGRDVAEKTLKSL